MPTLIAIATPKPETRNYLADAESGCHCENPVARVQMRFLVKNWEIRLRRFGSYYLPGFSHLHLTMFLRSG